MAMKAKSILKKTKPKVEKTTKVEKKISKPIKEKKQFKPYRYKDDEGKYAWKLKE